MEANMQNPRRLVALVAALAASLGALSTALPVAAQQGVDGPGADLDRYAQTGEWMTSGLMPLVMLIGLGVIVALVAAILTYMVGKIPERRWRGGA
jgi:hypothetical protein